jgi:hypothetical protein
MGALVASAYGVCSPFHIIVSINACVSCKHMRVCVFFYCR